MGERTKERDCGDTAAVGWVHWWYAFLQGLTVDTSQRSVLVTPAVSSLCALQWHWFVGLGSWRALIWRYKSSPYLLPSLPWENQGNTWRALVILLTESGLITWPWLHWWPFIVNSIKSGLILVPDESATQLHVCPSHCYMSSIEVMCSGYPFAASRLYDITYLSKR